MIDSMFSGKYRILNEVARGGMGVVYRALDVKLNRHVAIKVLHAHFSGDPSFAERFLAEARAMARLDHDNIMCIFAVEEQQDAHYIVMEYFPGTDLRALIKERRCLSVDETLRFSLQVAQALAYAHKRGIIHRDIKPANVMVDTRGRVKIADFGIAAAIDEASLTITGQVIGTPEYMSPEQVKGVKGESLDGRSDLYSLGILMYEMLTGATPYHATPKTAIIGSLLYDRNDVDLEFPETVPPALQGVITGLLKKDRQQRTSNAEILESQLIEILRTMLVSEGSVNADPTVIVSPSGSDRKPAPAEQNLTPGSTDPKTSPGLPTSPPGAIQLGETDVLPPRTVPPVPLEPKKPAKGLSSRYHFLPWIAGALVAVAVASGGYYVVMKSNRLPFPPKNETSPAPAPNRGDAKPPSKEPDPPNYALNKSTSPSQALKELDTLAEKPAPPSQAQITDESRRLVEDQARLEAKLALLEKQIAAQKEEDAQAKEDRQKEASKVAERLQRRREDVANKKKELEARKELDRQLAAKKAQKEAERQRLEKAEADRKKAEEESKERERQLATQKAKEAEQKQKEDAEKERLRQLAQLADQKEAEQKEAERQAEMAAAKQRQKEQADKERLKQLAAQKEAEKEAERAAELAAVEQKQKQADSEKMRLAEAETAKAAEPKVALLALQRQQLDRLLENFKKAYESQDLRTLQAMSTITQERARNLEFMFETYRTIRLSIGKVMLTDEGASATVILDELVKNNGERVKLNAIGSAIKLKIRKEGSEWGKIVW